MWQVCVSFFHRVFCNAQEENILHYVCPGESALSSSRTTRACYTPFLPGGSITHCFERIGGNGGPGIDLSAEFGLEFGVLEALRVGVETGRATAVLVVLVPQYWEEQ